jgi:hypothetical protein
METAGSLIVCSVDSAHSASSALCTLAWMWSQPPRSLVIESRWESKPPTFAGELQPQRLNKTPF